jgi:hypothetical protein
VSWTPEDEEALQSLQARKKAEEEKNFQGVYDLVEQFHFRNMGAREVAQDIIQRADEFRKALKPFTGGK